MSDQTLADLKREFPGRNLLTPAEIAKIINSSTAVQANMRSQRTFPIPIVRNGRKIGISINDLANYLNGKLVSKPIESTSKDAQGSLNTNPIRKRARKRDWMLAFQSGIQFQLEVFAELEKLYLEESLTAKDLKPAVRRKPF